MVKHVAHHGMHRRALGACWALLGLAGLDRQVICLPGLVCPEDVLGMFQVVLGQPEVILWSIAFEVDQELHQLWRWSLTVPHERVPPRGGGGGRVSSFPHFEVE